MSVKIYENGAWRDASFVRRFDGTSWVDIEYGKIYENGQWVDVWTDEIQIGETVSFISTPVPYNVSIDENSTAVVGYFSKPLTPGIYQIWADEAHWYHVQQTDYWITFDLFQRDVGICRASIDNNKGFVYRNFGYADTSHQDSRGDNWANIVLGQPYVKVTGKGIVEMQGCCSRVMESNTWGYPTLKVISATITRIS